MMDSFMDVVNASAMKILLSCDLTSLSLMQDA